MELKEIGYFSKTHGIKGHLILKSNIEFYFEDLNALFIDLAGSKAPYFVKEINEGNNGLIILLEEVDAVEKAKLLIGKKVFIDEQLIAETDDEMDWVGFELIDEQFGSLGKIKEVNDNGVQVLVSLSFKEKELILPLVDDFIQSVDEKTKILKYKAPDGLIEMYLNIT